MSYKKARSIPAKVNKEQQQVFLNTQLIPLLKQAENNEIELYFGDAVHIIYGACLGYSWCRNRQEVKSAYGRKRFNVMGAYNCNNSETITVTNTSYITSSEIVELFEKLRKKNENKKVVIVLDNARYQKCELVKQAAIDDEIQIVYLPVYSPNLNLIERLWKWLRKKCLNNKYSETFAEFCESITNTLSQTNSTFLDEITTALAHNFEVLGV